MPHLAALGSHRRGDLLRVTTLGVVVPLPLHQADEIATGIVEVSE